MAEPTPGPELAQAPNRTQPISATRPPWFERVFNHPQGLAILFLTEMWERFSFYGMRGLLKGYMVYYLFVDLRQKLYVPEGVTGAVVPTTVGHPYDVLGWQTLQKILLSVDPSMDAQGQASMVYGLYNGLVYLTPVLGGLLADRFFGQRRIVVFGALAMAAGQFLMSSDSLFFVALLVLILGNGAFKPNISTQVGNLYPDGDPRRDRAYSIFYVGINLGSFICSFICGTLAAVYGWHYGFMAAGIGLLIGLVIYLYGQRHLAPDNMMRTLKAPVPSTQAQPNEGTRGTQRAQKLTKKEWSAILSLIVLCALNVPFWAVYEQQGNTMQTWADQQTIWPVIWGFQVPSTWFQSFNPAMIILLTPLINGLWEYQHRRGREPSTVAKMAIGSFILGGSFIVMVVGARVIGDGRGSCLWPFGATMILTVGELYLSPIGLSLVTKASPKRLVSLMMGIWFISSFLGGFASGVIGVFYTKMPRESFFWMLTIFGMATGSAMWAMARPIKRALGENA